VNTSLGAYDTYKACKDGKGSCGGAAAYLALDIATMGASSAAALKLAPGYEGAAQIVIWSVDTMGTAAQVGDFGSLVPSGYSVGDDALEFYFAYSIAG
jgi:hypothetical protein